VKPDAWLGFATRASLAPTPERRASPAPRAQRPRTG